MIRLCGWSSIAFCVFLLGFRVGIEVAIYQGTAQQLAEAARLRILYLAGHDPAQEIE